MQRNDKFLVQFLDSFTAKQLFFLVWAAIAFSFVMMMVAYYRKTTRRNFRHPSDGPGPKVRVDNRQLGSGPASQSIVPKSNMPKK